MPFHPRRFTIVVFAVLLAIVTWGPSFASASAVPADQRAGSHQVMPAHDEATQADDRRAVTLGTLGVVAAAGIVVGAGYVYRRKAGMTPHYDDGFTPRDPRDRPSH